MQVQIQVIKVGKPEKKPSKNGGYEKLEVTYKDTASGKVAGKSLVSFGDYAHVFKAAKDWQEDQIVNLQLEKVNDYWTWVNVIDGDPEQETKTVVWVKEKAVDSTPAKQQWVPDEVKQRLIVRQSCLAQAVNFEKDNAASIDTVFKTANQFFDWVFEKGAYGPAEKQAGKALGRPKKVVEESEQEVE